LDPPDKTLGPTSLPPGARWFTCMWCPRAEDGTEFNRIPTQLLKDARWFPCMWCPRAEDGTEFNGAHLTLGSLWFHLAPSWILLDPPDSPRGPPAYPLGATWRSPGPSWGSLDTLLSLRPSWDPPDAFLDPLGPSFGLFRFLCRDGGAKALAPTTFPVTCDLQTTRYTKTARNVWSRDGQIRPRARRNRSFCVINISIWRTCPISGLSGSLLILFGSFVGLPGSRALPGSISGLPRSIGALPGSILHPGGRPDAHLGPPGTHLASSWGSPDPHLGPLGST
jgi:hypothetical protein